MVFPLRVLKLILEGFNFIQMRIRTFVLLNMSLILSVKMHTRVPKEVKLAEYS